jgi:hypothetical protein
MTRGQRRAQDLDRPLGGHRAGPGARFALFAAGSQPTAGQRGKP